MRRREKFPKKRNENRLKILTCPLLKWFPCNIASIKRKYTPSKAEPPPSPTRSIFPFFFHLNKIIESDKSELGIFADGGRIKWKSWHAMLPSSSEILCCFYGRELPWKMQRPTSRIGDAGSVRFVESSNHQRHVNKVANGFFQPLSPFVVLQFYLQPFLLDRIAAENGVTS